MLAGHCTKWRLADRTHVKIISWIDDHSRYPLCVSACRRITGAIVLATSQKANGAPGIPASTLTDNGTVVTTRLSGGKVAPSLTKRNPGYTKPGFPKPHAVH